MPKINYKNASRENWAGFGSNENPASEFPGIDYVNMASFQRIADATEAMAKNHIRLQEDYEYMKKSRDTYRDRCQRCENSMRSLKGVITKLKKKVNGQDSTTAL